jgi:hypothetical protein
MLPASANVLAQGLKPAIYAALNDTTQVVPKAIDATCSSKLAAGFLPACLQVSEAAR